MDINKEIAEKVMRWEWNEHLPGWYPHDGTLGDTLFPSEWKPSERIEQAWMVVEKMISKKYEVRVSYDWFSRLWLVEFWDTDLNCFDAVVKTASEAICKAALKCVEDKK